MGNRRTIVLVLLAAISAALIAFLLFDRDGEVDRLPSRGESAARASADADPVASRGAARTEARASPASPDGAAGDAPASPAATGSIRVRVVDSGDESRVPGASLTFWAGGAYRSGTTNEQGEALFPDLEGPRGNVLVAATGRADVRANFVVERGMESLVIVESRDLGLLHGLVRSSLDGRPVAGASVTVEPNLARADAEVQTRSGGRTGSDGRFALPRLSGDGSTPIFVAANDFVQASRVFSATDGALESSPAVVDLDPSGVIRGIVRDRAGEPVEGARVAIWPADGSWSVRVPVGAGAVEARAEISTDRAGAFRFEDRARGGLYRVRVSPAGAIGSGAATDVFLPPDQHEVAVDLVLGGTGKLRVRWSPGSTSGPPAQVAIRQPDSGSDPIAMASAREPPVEFDSLPQGPVAVHVRTGEGRGEATAVVTADPSTEVEVAIRVGASIEGVVRDSAGNPVAVAQVMARLAREGAEGTARAASTAWLGDRVVVGIGNELVWGGTTKRNGVFRVDNLEAGSRYTVFVVPSGSAAEVHAPATGVVLTAPASGAISGRLLLPAGCISPEWWSFVLEPETDAPRVLRLDWDDGRFQMAGLPAGRARFSAMTVDTRLPPREIQVPADGNLNLGDLAMEPGAVVRGSVRDAAGAGIAGVPVRVTGPRLAGVSGVSLADGRFVLGCLPPGTYLVLVGHQRFGEFPTRHSIDVGAKGADVVLVHLRGGTVRGTARTVGGVPLAGAGVRVAPVAGGDAAFVDTVDHRGRWETTLPAGEYRVEAVFRNERVLAEGRATVTEGGEVVLDLVGER